MLFLTLLASFPLYGSANCKLEPGANIVLLKLDDVVAARNQLGVSAKWDKVTTFLEMNKIAASYGVIGDSLELDNPAYFTWLKKRIEEGNIELWNHGYTNTFIKNKVLGYLGEFNGRSAEQQAESISRTQTLGYKRLGIMFRGFGPHNSAVDKSTYQQLDKYPSIQYVWFYPPQDELPHEPYVFKRVANLEHPIFRPNFELFLKDYYKRPQKLGYIALQGHPNMWADDDFDNFVKIVRFLQNEKVVFCKPLNLLNVQ